MPRGKTYDQSSSENDGSKAFAAFDGDRLTRFSSKFASELGGTLSGTWLSVDFGAPITANTLYIDECTWYHNHIDDFTVQINDGGQWKDLYHGTTVGEYAKIDIPEFTSDKLRILINAATGDTVTIWEIKVTYEETLLRGASFDAISYESNEDNPADDKLPELAFDNNHETRFSTALYDTINTWLSVDFGRPVTLNKLYVDECIQWGHVKSFQVQIKDGEDWKTIYTGSRIGRYAEITIPVVTTQEIRLFFTDSEGITVTLYEVSFGLNCTEAKNLAAGKTGTASSGDAASAFDGSMATSWQANASEAQPWLVLDLGVNRNFNCMVLEEDTSAGAITSYELQKKTYSGWESFYGGGSVASGERLFFEPQSTSQVRLLITDKTGSVGIKEMRVYNDGNARTPDVLGDGWFRLPFAPASDDITGKALYLLGGYNTIDHGRINSIWGANTPHETLFIGDKAGDVVVTFQSGAQKRVPLIFGYTMWFYENWNASKGPVVTENGPQPCANTLQESLYLQGGFEGQKQGVLKIAIPDGDAVKSISIEDNPEKFGAPIFTGGYITSEERPGTLTGGETINVDNEFFDSHTVDINDPYNEGMQQKVYATSKIFYNDEADFQSAPPFSFPENYNGYKITFSGTPFANIATGALYENVQNLSVRVDPDGFIRTSAKGAPNWWYDGFGAYILSAGTYSDHCWSRDGSRGILSLVASGNIEPAERALGYIHKWTMYFPENNLTINGKAIPGHCTTVVNKPFFGADSAEAGTLGYPSRYTRELFGDDFKNIGNHGAGRPGPYDDGHLRRLEGQRRHCRLGRKKLEIY